VRDRVPRVDQAAKAVRCLATWRKSSNVVLTRWVGVPIPALPRWSRGGGRAPSVLARASRGDRRDV